MISHAVEIAGRCVTFVIDQLITWKQIGGTNVPHNRVIMYGVTGLFIFSHINVFQLQDKHVTSLKHLNARLLDQELV